MSDSRIHPSRSDAGFSLAALITFMTVLSILLAAAVPVYTTRVQRELEEELIFRGEEYVRAIRKYQRQFGVYPPDLDALLESNGMRFLRRAYVDPITGEPFRLITARPDGTLDGSTIYKYEDFALFAGPLRTDTSGPAASEPAPEPAVPCRMPPLGRNRTRDAGPGPLTATWLPVFGLTQGGGFGAPGRGPDGGRGPSGDSQSGPRFPGSPTEDGSGGASDGPGTEGGLPQFRRPGPGTGDDGRAADPSARRRGDFSGTIADQITNRASGDSGGGPSSGGGGSGSLTPAPPISGVVGVAPDNEACALKVYNGRTVYAEWEFIALPTAPVAAASDSEADGEESPFAPSGGGF